MRNNNGYFRTAIINGIHKSITSVLENSPLVRYGFVQKSSYDDNSCEDLFDEPVSREHKLEGFGFTDTSIKHLCDMEDPFLYNRKVESVGEEFAYIMVNRIAQLACENIAAQLVLSNTNMTNCYHRRLLHRLNCDEQSDHVVLYPVTWDFNNIPSTEHMVKELMERKLPNVHLQPFMLDDEQANSLNRLFLLTAKDPCFGSLGYCIQPVFDKSNILTVTMRLFYKDNE